jgi:hypothetical protein
MLDNGDGGGCGDFSPVEQSSSLHPVRAAHGTNRYLPSKLAQFAQYVSQAER